MTTDQSTLDSNWNPTALSWTDDTESAHSILVRDTAETHAPRTPVPQGVLKHSLDNTHTGHTTRSEFHILDSRPKQSDDEFAALRHLSCSVVGLGYLGAQTVQKFRRHVMDNLARNFCAPKPDLLEVLDRSPADAEQTDLSIIVTDDRHPISAIRSLIEPDNRINRSPDLTLLFVRRTHHSSYAWQQILKLADATGVLPIFATPNHREADVLAALCTVVIPFYLRQMPCMDFYDLKYLLHPGRGRFGVIRAHLSVDSKPEQVEHAHRVYGCLLGTYDTTMDEVQRAMAYTTSRYSQDTSTGVAIRHLLENAGINGHHEIAVFADPSDNEMNADERCVASSEGVTLPDDPENIPAFLRAS